MQWRQLTQKKTTKFVTNKLQEWYEKAKIFVKKILKTNILKIKNIVKLETIAIIQLNIELVHITYDHHCITEELAEELNGQFTCLEEKTEKYITFSAAIKKEVSRIT